MKNEFIAQATITINAPVVEVWDALVNPEKIKQYMFGADVKTDWKVGSPIVYTGMYEGQPFEEKGEIKKIKPMDELQTTNFSSMSGKPDIPENYVLVTYQLQEDGKQTQLTVSQNNIETQKGADGSTENWRGVLKGLKKVVEDNN